MKILAIGDPHGKLPRNLDNIISKKKIDLLVCVGDVPPVPRAFRKGEINYFPKDFLKKSNMLFKDIVKKLCSYKKPVLILRGNMYLTGSRDKLTKKIFSSHKNLIYKKTGKVEIDGKEFILFDMSFEPHMYRTQDSWMRKQFISAKKRGIKINKLMKITESPVIISHAPPFGYLDKTVKGKRGSKILLKLIRKHKPELVLCGHIHESKGIVKIGRTTVINLGCCGNYKVLEI
jgi:Icc-related predicted phosphoesterase